MGITKLIKSNSAVSEVLGTVLLLSIVSVLFTVISLAVFNFLPTNSGPSANIFCQVNGEKIILTHEGGDDLSLDTKIGFSTNLGSTAYILVKDGLNSTDQLDGKWNIGERIIYSDFNLLENQIRVTIIDPSSNSLILVTTVPLNNKIVVTTLDATTITIDSAVLLMDYDFRSQSGSIRFTYRSNYGNWTNTTWISKSGSGFYSLLVSDLSPLKLYYFKAQLLYNSTILEGEQKSFTTLCPLINTWINSISPYILSTNPLMITATGASELDNVTLYYRWSDDNVSWTGGLTEVNDPVDSNTCNIDGLDDKGLETNFLNCQGISTDSNVMMIQEVNQGGVVNENKNYVDTQSNLQPPTDIGAHSSFVEIQDCDGIYDTLTEGFVPPQVIFQSAGTGSGSNSGNPNPSYPTGLALNDLILLQVTLRRDDSSFTITPPSGFALLYGPDISGSGDARVRQWIYYKFSDGTESGTATVTFVNCYGTRTARMYSFRNVALTSFTEGEVVLTDYDDVIDAPTIATTGNGRLAVSFISIENDISLGSFSGESGGDWTEAMAEYKFDGDYDLCMQLQTATIATGGTIFGGSYDTGFTDYQWVVRGVALKPITSTNYRLDLEVGWTNVDYDQTNEYLCIYGGTQDSEILQIDVWNGAWTTVIPDLSSGWNNISVSSYLTSSTFQIRFIDGTQNSDTTQSTWQVEGVLLHTWSEMSDYQINFEYQWTSVNFNQINKQICVYVSSHTGGAENLLVNYWTGSTWSSLGTITITGWSNFTATGLTSSTYTIQLIGSIELGDTNPDTWDIDLIMLHTWNSTGGSHGHNWIIWPDVYNPDQSPLWSWNFTFPDGVGFYEFYSLGKDIDHCESDIESAPINADARCRKT